MATHSSIPTWRISWTRGAWCAVIHGVAKSRTRLSDWTELMYIFCFANFIPCIVLCFPVASVQFSSVQFSCSVVSDSLRPHEPQHARPPCPSPTPGVYPNSYPLSQWCHPTISSTVIPFSSSPQSFPASGSFQVSQLFTLGGQSIGVSASHQSFQWTPRTDLL